MSIKITTFAIFGGSLLLAASASAQTTLAGSTRNITSATNGGPSGVAAGDMDGDGRPEIAYNLRYGRDDTSVGTAGDSSLVVYTLSGSTWTRKFQVNTSLSFQGFPSFGDFDGDGLREVAVCELVPSAATGNCRAYKNDGTVLAAMNILGVKNAAMTNSGPSVADLNGDGIDDLVVPTYDGLVIAKLGNGAGGFTTDLFTQKGEKIFGHVAVGDLFRDGSSEIVVGGLKTGAVHVLSGSGAILASSPAQYDATTNEGHFYYGSGPSLANLDSDANLEVVSIVDYYTASQDPNMKPRLVVHEVTPSTVTRAAYYDLPSLTSYTAPVVGDITGDGSPEIVLIDNVGTVRAFRYSGGNTLTQIGSVNVDAASWASPALLDVDGDGDLEIAVTGTSGAYIVTANSAGALTKAYQWSSAGSTNVFPQTIIVDADGDAQPEMFTGTWSPARVAAIDLPFSPSGDWSAFGRNGKHQGAITSGRELLGNDLSIEYSALLTQLEVPPTGCTAGDATIFATASDSVETSYRNFLRGQANNASNNLRLAHNSIVTVSGACPVTRLRERIARLSALGFRQYIDRATPVIGPGTDINTANATYNLVVSYLDASNWQAAVNNARNPGTTALTTALNAATGVSQATCTKGSYESYLAAECALVALAGANPSNADLQNLLLWVPDPNLHSAYGFANAAVVALPTTQSQREAALALQRLARIYLDDVSVWFKAIDPTGIQAAEADYTSALTAMNAANYPTAATRFRNAVRKARPCPNLGDGVVGDVACLP